MKFKNFLFGLAVNIICIEQNIPKQFARWQIKRQNISPVLL
jgi:hypothetical protein